MMSVGANAQYQLENSDFEQWESVTYDKTTGNEPVKWSSFLDGTGDLKSMAGYSQLEKSTDKPAGSNGSYSAKLTSRAVKFLGATIAVAQGNLTNGCINMGSTTATDATGNYNYINTSRSDQSMKFTGHPDAVSVWVKFKGSKTGNVEVVLVTDGYYQSPEVADKIKAKTVAHAQNSTMPSNDKWTEYVIPFTYTGNAATPIYSLVNISTCATPGAGKEADYMYVDDMKMLYYSELSSVKYNGTSVSVSSSMNVDAEYEESKLSLTSNGKAATIEKSFDASICVLTVTVKGENISEDSSNKHVYTIQFKKPVVNYTITFNVDGVETTSTVAEGEATPKPADPTKAGYTFAGWTPAVSDKVTGNATYTATWTANKHNIVYKVDGEVYQTVTDVEYNSAINPIAAPTKEGYTFSGWSEIPATMPDSDVEITGSFAINEYKITFYIDDVAKEQTVKHGEMPTPPADPTKEGYKFEGWGEIKPATEEAVYSASWSAESYKLIYMIEGESESYSSLDVYYNSEITPIPNDEPVKEGYTFGGWIEEIPARMPAHDVTITGKWIANKYNVTFKFDDKTLSSETLDCGAPITAPADPIKEGYTFIGWSPSVDATVPAKDVTYTADFVINEYKVAFVADGNTLSQDVISYGALIVPPAAPEKEGYTFKGWDNGFVQGSTTVPATDITYTAEYSVNQYKVTFVVDGTTVKEENLDFGSAISAPSAPTKDGYEFLRWDPEFITGAKVPAKDVTYNAVFGKDAFVITYMLDGQVYTTSKVEFGTAVTAIESPVKEGYTFSGWSGVPATMPAEAVTVTGSFTVNKYNVKFVDEDGKVYSSESVEYGSAITAPAAPTKDGYEFTGWTPEVASTVPAKDVTYTATWKENVPVVDAIAGVSVETGAAYYTANGVRLSAPRKGVNIVKLANGQVKKVYVK